jgi:hypothetical protein
LITLTLPPILGLFLEARLLASLDPPRLLLASALGGRVNPSRRGAILLGERSTPPERLAQIVVKSLALVAAPSPLGRFRGAGTVVAGLVDLGGNSPQLASRLTGGLLTPDNVLHAWLPVRHLPPVP